MIAGVDVQADGDDQYDRLCILLETPGETQSSQGILLDEMETS